MTKYRIVWFNERREGTPSLRCNEGQTGLIDTEKEAMLWYRRLCAAYPSRDYRMLRVSVPKSEGVAK